MSEEIPEAYSLLIDQIRSITKSLNADDAISAISETDTLMKTLSKENIEKYKLKELQRLCNTFLLDNKNNRILRINQRIKEEQETAIEYYDKDIGEDHRLFYDEELEKELLKTYNEIRKLLATLIKEKLTDTIDL